MCMCDEYAFLHVRMYENRNSLSSFVIRAMFPPVLKNLYSLLPHKQWGNNAPVKPNEVRGLYHYYQQWAQKEKAQHSWPGQISAGALGKLFTNFKHYLGG